MPRFSESGADMVICQVCGRDLDSSKVDIQWVPVPTRPDKSYGNVCKPCRDKFKAPPATAGREVQGEDLKHRKSAE